MTEAELIAKLIEKSPPSAREGMRKRLEQKFKAEDEKGKKFLKERLEILVKGKEARDGQRAKAIGRRAKSMS